MPSNPFAGTNNPSYIGAGNESNAFGPPVGVWLNSDGTWTLLSQNYVSVDYAPSQSGRWLASGFNATDFEIYWTGAITTGGYDSETGGYYSFTDVQSSSDQNTWTDLSTGWHAAPAVGSKTITIMIRKKNDPSVSTTFTVTFYSYSIGGSGE
jgi:hypothetical protein